MTRIEEEARRLYERVMEKFFSQPTWSEKSLEEMLAEELARYDGRIRPYIEEAIYSLLEGSFKTPADFPDPVPTPVELSAMLYANSKKVQRDVTALLMQSIRAKETARDIAMKLYEGYDFNDREVLDAVKKLPLYLKKELQKPKVRLAVKKQVAKLKTKPLRAAYAQLVKAIEKQNQTALEKAMKVALEEKSRYFATRIAQTETQRAANLSRAKRYLEDDRVTLVQYYMSSRHPKVDICDYHARLDVGYGPGIVPKEQMVTLPLHPHCMCRYRQYVGKVKKRTVRDPEAHTMAKFSDWEQKEILGSWEAWERWKSGTPAVELWNMARPKYPVQPVKNVLYNGGMEKYRDRIVWKFDNFPTKSKKDALKHFKTLWRDEESFDRHLEKRMKEGTVEDAFDYLAKTVECLSDAKTMTVAKHENSWDRIHCASSKGWFVVFNEYGTIMTSHKKDETKKPFEQKHRALGAEIEKGEVDEEFREFFERLQNELGIF